MDFLDGKGAEQVISDYIEREMSEYKKVTERELAATGVAPEAKEAFNRKPYYNVTGSFVKKLFRCFFSKFSGRKKGLQNMNLTKTTD